MFPHLNVRKYIVGGGNFVASSYAKFRRNSEVSNMSEVQLCTRYFDLKSTRISSGGFFLSIALGGIENYATMLVLHNSIKNNPTLDKLQWTLCPVGDCKKWDGITNLYCKMYLHQNTK